MVSMGKKPDAATNIANRHRRIKVLNVLCERGSAACAELVNATSYMESADDLGFRTQRFHAEVVEPLIDRGYVAVTAYRGPKTDYVPTDRALKWHAWMQGKGSMPGAEGDRL